LHALLHDEHGELAALGALDAGVDQEHVAQLGVEMAPLVIHILAPLSTYVSPSRRASVRRPSTSVPAPGSLMHMPPMRSPVQAVGQVAHALRLVAVHVQVVGEQHGVRQVRQREGRVGRRQLLVRDDRGGGVEPCAAHLFAEGDAQQAQLAQLAEERHVEGLGAVDRRPQ
jgi:hypothetical protein